MSFRTLPAKLSDRILADLDRLLRTAVNAAHAQLTSISEAGAFSLQSDVGGRANANTILATDAVPINPETLLQSPFEPSVEGPARVLTWGEYALGSLGLCAEAKLQALHVNDCLWNGQAGRITEDSMRTPGTAIRWREAFAQQSPGGRLAFAVVVFDIHNSRC